MTMILLIGGAVVFVVFVLVAVFRRRDGVEPDLGSVSRSWTTEHNASHGKDSSSN
jgi:hypothetical protein